MGISFAMIAIWSRLTVVPVLAFRSAISRSSSSSVWSAVTSPLLDDRRARRLLALTAGDQPSLVGVRGRPSVIAVGLSIGVHGVPGWPRPPAGAASRADSSARPL